MIPFRKVAIVTGSRHWTDWATLYKALDAAAPELVVHGGADGADGMAESWAKSRQIDSHPMRAKWGCLPNIDRRAGLARNIRMLDAYPEALVLAFPLPDSRGTWHCVREAKTRQMWVEIIQPEPFAGTCPE